jgi:hypothetical protein
MSQTSNKLKSAAKSSQTGFVLSLEILLFASILIAGTITGWVMIRDSVNAELMDTANAIESAISFPFFADPLRGTGPDFSPDSFSFASPKSTE